MKPSNYKENRRDRRLAINQNGKRRVVVIMREREGRTLPFVFKSEAASLPTLESRIDASATVHADEASHWDRLHAKFLTKRINHEWAYSDEGACTNQAESYFSRLRRAEVGQHHHIAGPYLTAYSREIAWREDHRRVSNGEQYLMIAVGCAGASCVAPVEGLLAARLSDYSGTVNQGEVTPSRLSKYATYVGGRCSDCGIPDTMTALPFAATTFTRAWTRPRLSFL